MYMLFVTSSDPSMNYCDCDYRIVKTKPVGWRSRFCSVILPVQLLYLCQPSEPTSGDQVISDVVLVISLAVNFAARRLSSSLPTLSLQSEDRLMIIVKWQEVVLGIQGMTIYPQH